MNPFSLVSKLVTYVLVAPFAAWLAQKFGLEFTDEELSYATLVIAGALVAILSLLKEAGEKLLLRMRGLKPAQPIPKGTDTVVASRPPEQGGDPKTAMIERVPEVPDP